MNQTEATPEFTVVLLTLPDGRIALQRRTDDAPYAPGKLGLFGGAIEGHETPDECIWRELKEEIAYSFAPEDIRFLREYTVSAVLGDYPVDRRFYLYEASLPSESVEIYEGTRIEAYALGDLLRRTDITPPTAAAINEHT